MGVPTAFRGLGSRWIEPAEEERSRRFGVPTDLAEEQSCKQHNARVGDCRMIRHSTTKVTLKCESLVRCGSPARAEETATARHSASIGVLASTFKAQRAGKGEEMDGESRALANFRTRIPKARHSIADGNPQKQPTSRKGKCKQNLKLHQRIKQQSAAARSLPWKILNS